MDNRSARETYPFNETGVGTNSGVSVTHAAAVGFKHVVTAIDASGDAAAVVTIEMPAGTIVWRKRFAGAFTVAEEFTDDEYTAPTNTNVVVKISASTSNCEANIAGYTELG